MTTVTQVYMNSYQQITLNFAAGKSLHYYVILINSL